jgi:hypothetical protein
MKVIVTYEFEQEIQLENYHDNATAQDIKAIEIDNITDDPFMYIETLIPEVDIEIIP